MESEFLSQGGFDGNKRYSLPLEDWTTHANNPSPLFWGAEISNMLHKIKLEDTALLAGKIGTGLGEAKLPSLFNSRK
ncbi:hypothetical protein [Candidatus Fokinia crypta]|uniref:Uncharacterized protein n=1 Tax=Candidatus Fokinia crypta TaxID=1920990 RepID=A0ABZ0US20_9RICK|nr:hypothetical protein [Candidatus Fokinia cryptica]WPX98056.1 hypothetical protein Fokcrypt_00584 [Candidatus Fokinia cryptica]